MSSSCVPTGLPFSTWPRLCPRCARTLRACCPWTRPFSVCRRSTRLCSTSCLCRGPLVAFRVQREARQLSQLLPQSGLLALPPGAKGNVLVVHRHVPQEEALPPLHRCPQPPVRLVLARIPSPSLTPRPLPLFRVCIARRLRAGASVGVITWQRAALTATIVPVVFTCA